MKIQGHNPIEGQELLNRAKDVNKNRDAGQKDNANKTDDSTKFLFIIESLSKRFVSIIPAFRQICCRGSDSNLPFYFQNHSTEIDSPPFQKLL